MLAFSYESVSLINHFKNFLGMVVMNDRVNEAEKKVEQSLPSKIRNFNDLPQGSLILPVDESEKFGIKNYQDRVAFIQVGLPNKQGVTQIWALSTEDFYNTVPYHGILKKIGGRAISVKLNPDSKEKVYQIAHSALIESPLLKALYEKEDVTSKESDNDNELTQYFDKTLNVALNEKVSDIHIEKRPHRSKVRMRKHGQLMDYEGLSSVYATQLCSVIYNVLGENRDVQYSEEDFQVAAITRTIGGEEVKLRYQSLPVYPKGFDVVLRVLPIGSDEEEFVSLQQLGYSDSQVRLLLEIVSRPVGALIIAGTTGSGKSTTLKNLLMFVNAARGYKSKIYTIEDPPEYKIPRVSQIPVVRRKKDEEKYTTKSPFQDPLVATMRGDPDVLMIGEIRDNYTGDGLKKATQSGHQVMSTVHAASALGIVERLIDFGISPSVMGSPEFLTGLIYQKLVPLLCQTCSKSFNEVIESATANPSDLDLANRLSKVADLSKDNIRIRGHDLACPDCNGMGIVGRTVCAEVISPDFEMLNYFRKQDQVGAYTYWRGLSNKDHYSTDMTGKTAAEHAIFKMRAGLISPKDVEELFGPVDIGQKLLEQSNQNVHGRKNKKEDKDDTSGWENLN